MNHLFSDKNPFDQGELAVTLSAQAERDLPTQWRDFRTLRKPIALIVLMLSYLLRATVETFHVFKSVTLSLDTSAYTAGDVLADTQEVADVLPVSGGAARLDTIVLEDKDDQTAADINLFFFSENVSLGTENSAPSITDANAAKLLGIVTVPSANFVDVGGAKIATVRNVGLLVKAATGKSIFVAATCAGTPTQTASGIVLNLGFKGA